jgi:hypothetical protein
MLSKVGDINAALGLSHDTSTKIKEALSWTMQYDPHPGVRMEAIRAIEKLGLAPNFREKLMTILLIDKSDKVRLAAENVLCMIGVLYPGFEDNGTDKRKTTDGETVKPYYSIVKDEPEESIDSFLRHSLVGDKEMAEVLEKVQYLSTKDQVMKQIEGSFGYKDTDSNGLQLQYDEPFHPSTKIQKSKHYLVFKNINRDKNGLPVF